MSNGDPKPIKVRTRFAPSPTGRLHIGGVRTALFNFLFAKKNNGDFILRIEDTDPERSNLKWEKEIIESLFWLGVKWDEGPLIVSQDQISDIKYKKYIGEYGPYRQSERLEIYAQYLEKLLKDGKAYFCFCSKEELETQRQYQLSIGQAPRYNGKCWDLPESTVKKYLAEGRPSIIRFKVLSKKVIFKDLIRGQVEFDSSLFGDISIARNLAGLKKSVSSNLLSGGTLLPLYNFAVVIDDFEMKISHVIRAEEHLSNTPKQILIQEALGFPQLEYAHVPLILGPDRSKLSKRHGATAVSDFKKTGYLPEALINFMVFLGWNPGGDREIFSMASLIKEFSLEKVQKGGAIFNIKKLNWINGFYIRQKSLDKLTELCSPYLIEKKLVTPTPQPTKAKDFSSLELTPVYRVEKTGERIDFNLIKKIVSVYQERLTTLSEISELTDFFFKDKLEYNKELLRWKPPVSRLEMSDKEVKISLDKLEKILSKIKEEEFTKENLEKILIPEAEKISKSFQPTLVTGDRGYLLWPFRVALTGKEASAGPFEIAEILGKEKVLRRTKEAKKLL